MSRGSVLKRWEFWLISGLSILVIAMIIWGVAFGGAVRDNGFMTYCEKTAFDVVVYDFTGESGESPRCSQPEFVGPSAAKKPWKVMPSGDPDFIAAVDDAINAFNSRLDCKLFTQSSATTDPDIVISRGAQEAGSKDVGGSTTHRLVDSNWEVDIVIYNLVLSDELQRGIMHELGHAAGLAHDPFRDSLMYKGTSGTARLTDNDRALLNARYCHATSSSKGPISTTH
jgi:hypothetical protein